MVRIVCPHCTKQMSIDETKFPLHKVSFLCPGCKGKITYDRAEASRDAPGVAAPVAEPTPPNRNAYGEEPGAITCVAIGVIQGLVFAFVLIIIVALLGSIASIVFTAWNISIPTSWLGPAAVVFVVTATVALPTICVSGQFAERRAKHAAAILAEHNRKTAQQQRLQAELVSINSKTVRLFQMLPSALDRVEEYLSASERDFEDRAYAPFWDGIEHSVTELAQFDEGLRTINANAERFEQISTNCDAAPPFVVGREELQRLKPEKSTGRLQQIVRRAQRDFQFATIFEQRKTNKILITGFSNLAQALDDIGVRICEAIDTLSGNVDAIGSRIEAAVQKAGANVDAAARARRCPNCNNGSTGARLYRCATCGVVFCGECSQGLLSTQCPRSTEHGLPVPIGNVG